MVPQNGIRRLVIIELMILAALAWFNDPVDASTCDYLTKLKNGRDAAELEEKTIKYQRLEDDPVIDLPICLIKEGKPCLGIAGLVHAERSGNEFLALVNHLTAEHEAKYPPKPELESRTVDKELEMAINELKVGYKSLLPISKWSCVSGNCDLKPDGLEGICAPGSQYTMIWKAYESVKEFEAQPEVQINKKDKKDKKDKKSGSQMTSVPLYVFTILVATGTINIMARINFF